MAFTLERYGSNADVQISVRENDTGYVQFVLETNGTAINVTGFTRVTLRMRDKRGNITSFASDAGSPRMFVTGATTGEVELRPIASDFLHSRTPYECYIDVYPTTIRRYSVPQYGPFFINVFEEF